MSRKSAKILGVVVLVALLASLAVYVVAQPPGGFQGGAGGGQPGANMFRAMMRGGGGTAIAVAGDAVFVVANGMLLKYDANTLELLAQVDLPQPAMPAGMPGQPAAQPGPGQ